MPTDRKDVEQTLRSAGLSVPAEDLDELTEGVAILRRLAETLAQRDADMGDDDA